MLVQAANNAGLKPLVIDLFADLDTQTYAVDFKQITALTIECLTPVVDYFIQHYAVTEVIYGSGFEQHPNSLHYLHNRLTLLGNTPETFIKLQDKAHFFSVLNKLNIPYPETVFIAPNTTQDWLIKPKRGQGGVGIQRIRSTNLGLYAKDTAVYWQKYQRGSQHSVLFLADGQQLQVIGFNTQWTTRLNGSDEFIFAGIMNYCKLTEAHKTRIIDWLSKLVPAFALKGLNSLDFIHDYGNSYILEINPRLSASLQLYEVDLLLRHIRVGTTLMEQRLTPPPQSGYTGYTGYQIIYAEQDIQIPEGYIWENGTMDIPSAGAMCKTGQPICSIIAHHNQAHAVLNELNIKQHTIKKGLYTHGTHT